MEKPKIFIGSDHGGFGMKEDIKGFLGELGYPVCDLGCHGTDAVDYPDFAFLVADAVREGRAAGAGCFGIMIDTIGVASAMVANKVPGIRAAPAFNAFAVRSSREHNDANVLTLGGGVLGAGLARSLVKTWLETPYGGGRHQRRVDKIGEVERRFAKG